MVSGFNEGQHLFLLTFHKRHAMQKTRNAGLAIVTCNAREELRSNTILYHNIFITV